MGNKGSTRLQFFLITLVHILLDVYLLIIVLVLVILIISGWFSLVERKVLAHAGNRIGPGVCGT